MVPSWSARGRSICKEQYFCLFSKCNISIFVPAWYLNICTRLGLSEAREQKAFIHIFTSSAEFIKFGVPGSLHFSLTFFSKVCFPHSDILLNASVLGSAHTVSSAAHTFFELFGGGYVFHIQIYYLYIRRCPRQPTLFLSFFLLKKKYIFQIQIS